MVISASSFIKTKGAKAVADATGWKAGAVRVWKCRDKFPRSAWPELSQAYPELTMDVLKELESAKTERAA